MKLVIKKHQFEAFQIIFRQDFIERVYFQLRELFGDENNINDAEFTKMMINDLIEEAEAFEFENESDIFEYIKLFYQYPKFQDRPLDEPIVEILSWPDRFPAVKFELLLKHIQEEDGE